MSSLAEQASGRPALSADLVSDLAVVAMPPSAFRALLMHKACNSSRLQQPK